MAQRIRVDNMPDEDTVPPLYPYNDKFGTILIDHWENSNPWEGKIRPSSFHEGTVPEKFSAYLSDTPYDGGEERIDKSQSELSPAFESDLTPTQQDIFIDIEEKWGFGPGADSWTNKDVKKETNATDSKETVKKATQTFESEGWATEVDKTTNGKVRRLTQSRFANPEAMADGGHDWNYQWETEVGKLRERSLWDATTYNPGKYDPKDWFGAKNEADIIALFEDIADVTETLVEIYDIRHEYAAELEEEQEWGLGLDDEEKTDYVKEIRECIQQLQKSLNDYFMGLKNLVSKFFMSCSNWWSVGGSSRDMDVPQEYHPTKKKNVTETRVDAKRWALTKTHFEPIIEGNPKRQAQDLTYPQRVEELEKSVRSLIHLTWYMKEDLLDGTEPDEMSPSEDTEPENTEPADTAEVDFDDLDRGVQLVEEALPDPHPMSLDPDGMRWQEFREEYREYMQDEVSADTVFRRLKKYHNWCLDADHHILGVNVVDEGNASESPEVYLRPVARAMDDKYFEKVPKDAEWPDRFNLGIDEQLIPTR